MKIEQGFGFGGGQCDQGRQGLGRGGKCWIQYGVGLSSTRRVIARDTWPCGDVRGLDAA